MLQWPPQRTQWSGSFVKDSSHISDYSRSQIQFIKVKILWIFCNLKYSEVQLNLQPKIRTLDKWSWKHWRSSIRFDFFLSLSLSLSLYLSFSFSPIFSLSLFLSLSFSSFFFSFFLSLSLSFSLSPSLSLLFFIILLFQGQSAQPPPPPPKHPSTETEKPPVPRHGSATTSSYKPQFTDYAPPAPNYKSSASCYTGVHKIMMIRWINLYQTSLNDAAEISVAVAYL